jgi:hypothetical protein
MREIRVAVLLVQEDPFAAQGSVAFYILGIIIDEQRLFGGSSQDFQGAVKGDGKGFSLVFIPTHVEDMGKKIGYPQFF